MVWFLVLLFSVFLIFYLAKPPNDFWSKYGIHQINNTNFKNHLMFAIGKESLADTDAVAYKAMGESRYCGLVEMGNSPTLLVKSLDVLKKVLIKDCVEHFVDRRSFFPETEPLFRKMLGSLEGLEWKGVRNSLSPTFTTGKIRRMMECFNQVGVDWMNHFKTLCHSSPDGNTATINPLSESTHFTVDIIAATVFGMSAGTIQNPKSTFSQMCHRMADFTLMGMVKMAIGMKFPAVLEFFGIRIVDAEVTDFFENILRQGMTARMNGEDKRNDFMQIVAEARKGELKAEGSDELDEFEKEAQLLPDSIGKKNYLSDEVTAMAQMVGFFVAGFTTTSNIVGFAVYALAVHSDVQEKLRKEVDQLFRNGNDIDYDALNQLPYMEMFISEVLRKYPPLFRLERKCVKDYHDAETGLTIPRGATVGVPVYSIHHDPQYYKYPDRFYPEHFSAEEKAKRSPYAYLPFGSGPRNCIGKRFALIQVKSGIAHLVHNFDIQPTATTPIPMKGNAFAVGVQVPPTLELKLSLRHQAE